MEGIGAGGGGRTTGFVFVAVVEAFGGLGGAVTFVVFGAGFGFGGGSGRLGGGGGGSSSAHNGVQH